MDVFFFIVEFHCIDMSSSLIHLLMILSCSHVLTIVNNAAMSLRAQISETFTNMWELNHTLMSSWWVKEETKKKIWKSSINKVGKNKYWWGCGERGILLHCWWERKLVQPLWKTVWRFLKMLRIELPYDSAIALLGIYPKDTNVVIQRDTSTPMFMAAMSTIAELWKSSQFFKKF